MALQVETTRRDPIRQFSVFAENRVGRLFDLISLFAFRDVHVMALSTLDTTESTIIRMVVDDPDLARRLLIEHRFAFTETDVIAVEVGTEMDIKGLLAALLESEMNIHYIYSFMGRPMGRAALVLKVDNGDATAEALEQLSFKVLLQSDISR
jgi:hypothetical protein